MYRIVEHQTVTNGTEVYRNEFNYCIEFRLRRNALHYVTEVMQSEYREKEFATEPRVGGIYCYKSEKTESGKRKVTEVRIQVVKA